MEPVAIPADTSRESWERLAQFWMASAMQSSGAGDRGLTPLEVQGETWARLESAFAAMFPGESFPLERIEPSGSKLDGRTVDPASLPGGVGRPGKMHWFVAAMPRESNGVTLGFDVDAEELASIASTYDPKWRPASVIMPDKGPSHWTGEFARFIPAKVEAAQFDGYFLWLLAEENLEGALRWLAADGAKQRSISWWPELPEVDGQSYLIHCALLTGEQPAIPNMKPLDEFFAVSEGLDPERVAALSNVPSRQLSVSALTIPSEEITMDPKNTKANAEPAELSITDQVPEGFKRALASLGLGKSAEPVEPAKDAAKEPAKATQDAESLTQAFAAAIKPLADQMASLTQSVAASTEAAKTALKARVTADLNRLVQSKRLSPPMRDLMAEQLSADGVTEAHVEATIARLAAMPPIHAISAAIPVDTGEGVVEYAELPRQFQRPAELGGNINPEHARVIASAVHAASQETDKDKARASFASVTRRGFGLDSPTNFLNLN